MPYFHVEIRLIGEHSETVYQADDIDDVHAMLGAQGLGEDSVVREITEEELNENHNGEFKTLASPEKEEEKREKVKTRTSIENAIKSNYTQASHAKVYWSSGEKEEYEPQDGFDMYAMVNGDLFRLLWVNADFTEVLNSMTFNPLEFRITYTGDKLTEDEEEDDV